MRLQTCAAVVPSLLGVLLASVLTPPALGMPPGQNGLIIWQRDYIGPHLWVANPDGSRTRRVLANAANRWEFEGTFSPTDPDLVFFSRLGRVPYSEDIYSGNLATGAVTRLTRSRAADLAPAVSPDGQRIAYYSVRERRGVERIHVANADGTGDVALTPRTRHSIDPDWSPDGTRIVYSEYRASGDRLVVMNADGTGRRPITAFGGAGEFNPKWMPDGQTIVFERLRGGTRSDIATISPLGGRPRALLATPAWETNPVPSPDGTRVVFTSDRDRPDRRDRRGDARERLGRAMEVYTMTVDGSDIDRLTNNRRADLWPDWQRLP